MINPINLDDIVTYICKEDRESENPTVWNFKPLTFKEERFLKKITLECFNNDSKDLYVDNARKYLDVGMIEPSNFGFKFERDRKASSVIENVKPWSDATLSSIPADIREELAAFVIKGYSDIKEEELKN